MGTIPSKITSLTIVYSTIYSDADQRKYQNSASLAFVRRLQRRPVNSPRKWPVTRKMFPLEDIMNYGVILTYDEATCDEFYKVRKMCPTNTFENIAFKR